MEKGKERQRKQPQDEVTVGKGQQGQGQQGKERQRKQPQDETATAESKFADGNDHGGGHKNTQNVGAEPDKPKIELNRTPISYKLDKLYNKTIRCPYCGTKIVKFTSTCENCGLTKVQIAESLVKKKNARKQQKRLWSKVHPEDIPYWKILLSAMFGFTGAHCFVTRRWIRGTYILLAMVAMLIGFIIFPIDTTNVEAEAVVTHPVRWAFDQNGLYMPQDVFGVVAIVLWIWDWIAILFGFFKYPVFVKIDDKKNTQVGNAGRKH
ncbi:MAG: hypothetical protein LBQ05_00460 [Christensenellaceae bacterium]|jgi:hypothetical protein|nr:hypothetical protein [Christensenellaceae bacterium]